MRLFYLLLGVAQLLILQANAQDSDSLQIVVGTYATKALKNYPSFWIVSNRFGIITNQNADFSTHFRIADTYRLLDKAHQGTRNTFIDKSRIFLSYGVDIYNNNYFKSIFFKEAYLKAGYKNWEIRGGRYEEIVGEVDPELSSGSFGVSNNALPIPKIGIAVADYTDVPFTKSWLQFKGQFSHGWLGNSNYLKGAYLHQKSFYLKAGKNRLQFYGGLNHFAQWGGVHPLGKAPNRFKDFLRIVVGAKGNGSDPVYQQGPIDIANAVGNHIIIPDFGITFKKNKSIFRLYTQTIFEKGVADSANQRDDLAGLKLLSRDRLVGLSWEIPENALIQKIVLEGIYTKYQGGPIIFRGRDNYYNNATYQTGWEYQERIIGTPLFINRTNAGFYKLGTNIYNLSNWNIVSNRVKGVHLGFKGNFITRLSYRALATYAQHYGNYYNNAAFTPFKRQIYVLYENSYQLKKTFNMTAALGCDLGELSKNIGVLLKLEWSLKGL